MIARLERYRGNAPAVAKLHDHEEITHRRCGNVLVVTPRGWANCPHCKRSGYIREVRP